MKDNHAMIRGTELNQHLLEHGWSESMIQTQGDGNGQFGPYAWAWHNAQHAHQENNAR